MTSPVPALPVGDVLDGLAIPALPEGLRPEGLLALVRCVAPDGGTSWSVRVTEGLDDDEVLGTLVGYVEHLKREAADAWDDTDPTRAGDEQRPPGPVADGSSHLEP